MSFFKALRESSKRWFDTYQKNQMLHILHDMSDRNLADIGVSRRKLQMGIQAYPWRDEVITATSATADVLTFKKPEAAATSGTAPHQDGGSQPKLAA